eukprot:TRINITY_DN35360_c0_g1_i2.p1 TRINITY_DN35360_c0_g1~~TRINITY_DN35360_c0_g1_i2.p1  ORF type:complete len:138 (-),score=25.44 TRINITY_DN35360_c0_g1_i2:137-520(-)
MGHYPASLLSPDFIFLNSSLSCRDLCQLTVTTLLSIFPSLHRYQWESIHANNPNPSDLLTPVQRQHLITYLSTPQMCSLTHDAIGSIFKVKASSEEEQLAFVCSFLEGLSDEQLLALHCKSGARRRS